MRDTYSRKRLAQLAQETLEIIERGHYVTQCGELIDISEDIQRAIAGTQLYTPDRLEEIHQRIGRREHPAARSTHNAVTNETTLAAAARVVAEDPTARVLCLSFGSATRPGGGFLRGAKAQEESIARASALYPTLLSQPDYYEANRRCPTLRYTDHAIVSPDVPVFRSASDLRLDIPYHVTVLTMPAPNASRCGEDSMDPFEQTMARRIGYVLSLAAHLDAHTLVLGAWGCGVFHMDPTVVSRQFADALEPGSRFDGLFDDVVFAVPGSTAERRVITAFQRAFCDAP